MRCIICTKESQGQDEGIPLCPREMNKMGLNIDSTTFPFAHLDCINDPTKLNGAHRTTWFEWNHLRLAARLRQAERDIVRLENAIAELPEPLAASFKDELEHIRATYPIKGAQAQAKE